MAFSTFLRSSVCTNALLSQQVMRFATQTALKKPSLASLSIISQKLQHSQNKPIYDAVRSLKTSAAQMSVHGLEKPHDHSKLWVIEKATSALLVPLIPAALLVPNQILDALLAILITAHSFWGLEAIAVDYARPAVVGPLFAKLAIAFVYILCIATLGGLFYIITHDIGIANSVRQLWSIKSNKA